MPTIAVDKAELYKRLGKQYTTEEFDELCFEFGIELDEDTSKSPRPIVNGVEEAPQLKIEIPANRYDMLCIEGIALNLNVFLSRSKLPNFKLAAPSNGELQELTVSQDTLKVRPFVSGAILRNIKFTQDRYDSFIALQDKLHQNLARHRTLFAIGTHDLDTIQGPFSYEALPPEKIHFVPLNQKKDMNGREIIELYQKDRHMKRYADIIKDSPVYPMIYDSNRTVLSLPPLINGDHSKITLDTGNVFIEITATDKTKVEIAICIMVAMFSEYCDEPYTVEPIKIISPHNKESREAPDLTPRPTQAEISYINSCCGLDLSTAKICSLLERMGYIAKISSDANIIDVDVPPTRADVLHQADIMEDVAIAYGFNNLPRVFPSRSGAVGQGLPINKVADIVRFSAYGSGWIEVLPLILCSHDENFAWLNKKDDGNTAVRLANPKTEEYQIVRTSLIPGLLKTLRENKHHSVPIRIFETSDVAFKDMSQERKSRNERHFAAAWLGKTSGFEIIHSLLDHVMKMLGSQPAKNEEHFGEISQRAKVDGKEVQGYWIEQHDRPSFLPGRAASICFKRHGKTQKIGEFGVLHPSVLKNFELNFPVSTLEMNIEVFL